MVASPSSQYKAVAMASACMGAAFQFTTWPTEAASGAEGIGGSSFWLKLMAVALAL